VLVDTFLKALPAFTPGIGVGICVCALVRITVTLAPRYATATTPRATFQKGFMLLTPKRRCSVGTPAPQADV
jgi:hypothetical protein